MTCRAGMWHSMAGTTRTSESLFVDNPTDELRQGDISYEWPFPVWNLNKFQVVTQVLGGGSPQSAVVSLLARGAPAPVAICSHDCEIENPRSRTGLLMAPVLPWPYPEVSSDLSLDLIGSREPDSKNLYSFIYLFPVNLGAAGQDDWHVIDFSAMATMTSPNKIKPRLLDGKRFEMLDKTRIQFKTKLAAFFGR